jgi:ATP-binding cassette, subfamily F, member 3
VKSSEQSVLSVVLEADVERTSLIQKEKTLLEQQQVVGDEPGALQSIMDQLTEVYERMSLIGANTAESRAASILSGMALLSSFVVLCCVVLCCVVLCAVVFSG